LQELQARHHRSQLRLLVAVHSHRRSTASKSSSVSKRTMNADAARKQGLELCRKRAFRSLKTVDLKVRPIHHHRATRVRAHILLLEWHMREAPAG
jgi:hypothetical protein